MEIDTQHGIKGILFSLGGIFLAYIVKDIIKGIYAFRNRNKAPTRQEFKELISALQLHTETLNLLKGTLNEQKLITDKMSIDIRRIYLFLKAIAGQQWPEYRKQVKEIEELDS